MATMASTHSVSILTNSSVKPPLNPKTGMSATLPERQIRSFVGNVSGGLEDYNDYWKTVELGEIAGSQQAFYTDPQHSLLQLSKLSDDEFYRKLLELKYEQRKVLQKCEKIYIEKHRGKVEPTFSESAKHIPKIQKDRSVEQTSRSLRSETFVDEDGILTAVHKDEIVIERSTSPGVLQENITDDEVLLTQTSAKPPTGRQPVISRSPPSRPRSAPLSREVARSLDDLKKSVEELRQSFEFSDDDYIPDDTVSEPYRPQERSTKKFETMWQNFSIDDYAPRRSLERPSSATYTPKEKKKKDDSWRHRLTVPRPFSMTLREEIKDKKKSKTMLELEEKMNQQQLQEEEEMNKKFKARPVPAHVYLPLYDEIREKSEERRRNVRQSCVEMLKSQEKPFSFTRREEDKKKHLTMSRDCNQVEKIENTPTFKAKPVPKSVFDSTVEDKMMEEEEYRKIRIKMRAEETLRGASLPPNMKAREQLKEQMERQQKIKSRRKGTKSASRPRINHDVPNYDALYRQFQQELRRRKNMKEATVTKPFQLETERTSKSARDRLKKEIEREEQGKENRWPYTLSKSKVKLGHMSSSLDALPAKSTRSADCRNSKTRSRMQELSQQELREIEEDRKRRVREIKMRREIKEKTKYNETPREKPEDKKKQYREAERSRMEEYERELQEMKDRVQRRPLLFEQESQVNAKKKAEKKFNATLRSVGLDEDFIESRGSRSASVHDYTDNYDDDDFEDTAVKYTDETYTKQHDSERSLSPEEA